VPITSDESHNKGNSMTLIYLAFGLVALAYLGLPLFIKFTMKLNARPALQPFTPKYAPEIAREYFEEVGPKLTSLGFETESSFTVEGAVPNVTSHVLLGINRKSGQAVTTCVMVTQPQGDKPPIVKTHVEFLTRLATGQSVTTSNSIDLGAFKKTSAVDALSAPKLQDINQLYQLHQWRESKGMSAAAERFLPAPGAALDWFADGYEESIARQVKTGYLAVDPSDKTMYSPTIQGAYMMTWGELPPMKQMRRGKEDQRAEQQVRQAGTRPIPAAAAVKITFERANAPAPARKAA
jgi:hypothetical protein